MKKKQQAITFRVTDEEYNMIKEKAKKADMTVTQFIVKCCAEKEVGKKQFLKNILKKNCETTVLFFDTKLSANQTKKKIATTCN